MKKLKKELNDKLTSNMYIISRIHKNELVDKNYSKIYLFCLEKEICEIADIYAVAKLLTNN